MGKNNTFIISATIVIADEDPLEVRVSNGGITKKGASQLRLLYDTCVKIRNETLRSSVINGTELKNWEANRE